jgi:hypothetical protein
VKFRSAGADGHPTPLERQTVVPLAVSEPKAPVPTLSVFEKSWVELTVFEKYPYVLVTLVPVASVKVMVWRALAPPMVSVFALKDPAERVVTVPLVARKLVAKSVVAVASVNWTVPPYKVPAAKVVMVPLVARKLVAKRAVEVVWEPVAFAYERFWRAVVPTTVKVEVTVLEEARNPPYSWSVWLVSAPRPVTVASVSASAPAGGQPNPFERQTPCPMMVEVPKVALFAKSWVVETVFEKYPYVEVTLVPVAFPKNRLVAAKVVTVPLVAWRDVAKKAVVVAFVEVTLPRYAFQRREACPSDMERSLAGRRYPPAAFKVMFPVVRFTNPSPYQVLAPLTKAPLV